MKKICYYIETDTGIFRDTLEVDDDMTEEEICDVVYDEVLAQIGWGWEEEE